MPIKIGALVLAGVMVLGMSITTFATVATDLGGSETGVAGKWENADNKETVGTSVNIKKQIIAYNPNGDDSTTTV